MKLDIIGYVCLVTTLALVGNTGSNTTDDTSVSPSVYAVKQETQVNSFETVAESNAIQAAEAKIILTDLSYPEVSNASPNKWVDGIIRAKNSSDTTVSVYCHNGSARVRIAGHLDTFSTHTEGRLKVGRTNSSVTFNLPITKLDSSTAELRGSSAFAFAAAAADGEIEGFGDIQIFPGPFRYSFSSNGASKLYDIVFACG